MRCQLWGNAIARMCRIMHRRSRGTWMISTSMPTQTVRLVGVVRCRRASTPNTWWTVHRRMMIGGFSPSWCTTRSTPWPTNWRGSSRRSKPTKRAISRKSTWKASSCWHWLRRRCRARSGVQSTLRSPGSPVIAAVRAMVVVRRVRSNAAGILRNATDAIW